MMEGELRSSAEKRAMALRNARQQDAVPSSSEDAARAMFELEVHQIELEMQNEELKRAQVELEASRSRYFELYDMAPVGYATVSEEGIVLESNLAFATLLGVTRSVLPGRSLSQFIRREYEKAYLTFQSIVMMSEETLEVDLVMVRQSSDPFWAHLTAKRTPDRDGKEAVCQIAIADIDARFQAEIQLAREKALLETTLKSVDEGVLSTDLGGFIVFANRSAESLTGLNREELLDRPMEQAFRIFDTTTGLKCGDPVREVLALGSAGVRTQIYLLLSKDGTRRIIESRASQIVQEDGKVLGAVVVFHDHTEKQRRQVEIEYLNAHDPLTGLCNRRYFDQVMMRLERDPSRPFALVMADVNGLKLTNDAFGHQAGDSLLKHVAGILQHESRSEDVVARIGGDEFVLILPETDQKSAEFLVERITKSIASEMSDGVSVSLSIGIALREDSVKEVDQVFREAEDRMYRNKLAESTSLRSRTIEIVMNTLFEKSAQEMLHSRRVGELSRVMAEKMEFDPDGVAQMRIAGLMHDIGKIGVDEKCLNKQTGLDVDEWREMHRHPETGFRILSSVREFSEIARFILEHHERWDGTGYPRGIAGEDISLQARIIHIVDSYEAMTTTRSYREAVGEEEAVLEIEKGAGSQFDPALARLFVERVLGRTWTPSNH